MPYVSDLGSIVSPLKLFMNILKLSDFLVTSVSSKMYKTDDFLRYLNFSGVIVSKGCSFSGRLNGPDDPYQSLPA